MNNSVELIDTAMTLIESGNIEAAQILLSRVLNEAKDFTITDKPITATSKGATVEQTAKKYAGRNINDVLKEKLGTYADVRNEKNQDSKISKYQKWQQENPEKSSYEMEKLANHLDNDWSKEPKTKSEWDRMKKSASIYSDGKRNQEHYEIAAKKNERHADKELDATDLDDIALTSYKNAIKKGKTPQQAAKKADKTWDRASKYGPALGTLYDIGQGIKTAGSAVGAVLSAPFDALDGAANSKHNVTGFDHVSQMARRMGVNKK